MPPQVSREEREALALLGFAWFASVVAASISAWAAMNPEARDAALRGLRGVFRAPALDVDDVISAHDALRSIDTLPAEISR